MNRREFSSSGVLALLAGVAATLTEACSSPVAPLGEPGVAGEISNNHAHRAVVTEAQLKAGGAVEIDIKGESGHHHYVDLSAEDVGRIAAGLRVSRVSSGSSEDKHDHVVTFN